MADLNAIVVVTRAYLAAWRGHGRHARQRLMSARHRIFSALLLLAGLTGAPLGGLLVGRWCTGLVLMAESAGAIWFGLMRDDGTGLPRRGERTALDAAREHMRGLP